MSGQLYYWKQTNQKLKQENSSGSRRFKIYQPQDWNSSDTDFSLTMGLDYARLVCDINLQTRRSSACAIMDTPLEDSQIAPRQALHPRELPMLFRGIAKCLSLKHLGRRLASYIEISILHSLVCLHLT